LLKDDLYNGFVIPQGTIVFVNAWGILHDESRFPDPFAFRPERYLPLVTGKASEDDEAPSPIDPTKIIFGYGRRVCPGEHVARTGLWMAMAMLLSSFEIKAKPESSNPADTLKTENRERYSDDEWTGEIVSMPKPFACDIKPRSDQRAELIRETVAGDERKVAR